MAAPVLVCELHADRLQELLQDLTVQVALDHTHSLLRGAVAHEGCYLAAGRLAGQHAALHHLAELPENLLQHVAVGLLRQQRHIEVVAGLPNTAGAALASSSSSSHPLLAARGASAPSGEAVAQRGHRAHVPVLVGKLHADRLREVLQDKASLEALDDVGGLLGVGVAHEGRDLAVRGLARQDPALHDGAKLAEDLLECLRVALLGQQRDVEVVPRGAVVRAALATPHTVGRGSLLGRVEAAHLAVAAASGHLGSLILGRGRALLRGRPLRRVGKLRDHRLQEAQRHVAGVDGLQHGGRRLDVLEADKGCALAPLHLAGQHLALRHGRVALEDLPEDHVIGGGRQAGDVEVVRGRRRRAVVLHGCNHGKPGAESLPC
mmetsp:Transcript_8708/g.25541  ORF Transcript_8708/g.25541 Transcript_8708/m.25541 type:complete len:377 (+) Transcript_8708:960-2090(+)